MHTAALFLILGASAFAQNSPALNGAYFLEEQGWQAQSGQPYRIAGLVQLDGKGTVSGTEFFRVANQTVARIVKGEYQLGADGMGSLTLRYDVSDDEGNVHASAANYRLVLAADRTLSLLRTDAGVLAAGALAPAETAAANLKGSYVVNELRQGPQPGLSLAVWTIDASGLVSARTLSRTFYQSADLVLSGQLETQADGSFNVRLSSPAATNEDGEALERTVLTYKLIPAGNSFELLRLDDGVFAETEVSKK